MVGEVVGSYRIDSVLGRGGMGVVYRAEHVQLGRSVALKMLQSQFTDDRVIVQRFFNEARAASAIDHPGIVEVFDYGVHTDGRAYLVMALLNGETLGAHLDQRVFEPREAAAIVAQVASVLAAAHAAGIIHRDLKPDNIMLVPNELSSSGLQVKLLDFGIAKLAHDPQGLQTQTGVVLGTPFYMSPEHCTGAANADHRSDLYSLGCILYHALTGRPPFEGVAAGAIIAAHLRDEPPDPRTFVATLPDDLVAITMQLLAKDPAARLPSALAVRDALGGRVTAAPLVSRRMTALSLPGVAPRHLTTASSAAAQVVRTTVPGPRNWVPIALGFALATIMVASASAYVSSRSEAPLRAAIAPPPSAVKPSVGARIAGDEARAALDPVPAPVAPKPERRPKRVSTRSPILGPERGPERAPERAPERTREASRAGITLGARHYVPGARVDVRFPSLTMSLPGARAWLAIAEVGKPSPAPGAWTHVEHGAQRVGLVAPAVPGRYEVRMYRNLQLQSAVGFSVEARAR